MGNSKAGASLAHILALVVIAGSLSACDVLSYDESAANFYAGSNNPPAPPAPPPPPPPGASFGPNFSEIQAGLFTPRCASCHSGGNPAAGLNLQAGSSYANLVGISSSQQAGLQRVNAGNPNQSYLIQKLEGSAATGGIMPPSGRIAQPDIDMVRQWITAGAIDDTVVVMAPIRVSSLSPAPGASLTTQPTQIVAGFSRDLDVSTVNALTFTLTASGGDGNFNSGNETQITASSISVPGANQASAVFGLTGVVLANDTYRVTLFGAGASFIMDLDANALDGEFSGAFPSGNGTQGGNFIAQFTLAVPVVLGPTLDQIQATVFTPQCASCHSGAGSTSGIQNMNLTSADASFMTLVNVLSTQDANLMRVLPGQPDNSYLVRKLQGMPTQGGVMPPTGMLPAAEISAIRQWISDGALR